MNYPETFLKCLVVILKHEGGYVNDTDDLGGETYRGVARKLHPTWLGWKVIDRVKHFRVLKRGSYINDTALDEQITAFYYQHFYTPMKLEHLDCDEAILELFDFGVNAGPQRAIIKAQGILHVVDDGIMGPITIAAINNYPGDFVKDYKHVRRLYYENIAHRRPQNKKFLKGWLNRVENTHF